MLKDYNYIKYPADRIYLRLGNLIIEIQNYCSENRNLEAYAYLRTIGQRVKPGHSNTEDVVKTEKFILSPGFLKNKCFREMDIDYIKPLIREYKLNNIGV